MSNIVRTSSPRAIRMSSTDNTLTGGEHLRNNNEIFRFPDSNLAR